MNLPIANPLRILVVEDDAAIHQLIRNLITQAGHAVVGSAYQGREAVELARQLRPDAVVLDVVMPDPDTGQEDRDAGLRAAEAILAAAPAPIVLLTAYESSELVARAARAGVGAYLVKPPSKGDLERALAVACARFADLQECRRVGAALRESEERYRALFLHSHEAIILGTQNGQVLTANPAACRLFGRSEQELRALGRNGLVDPDDTRLGPALARFERAGHARAELAFLRADGSRFEAEISGSVYADSHGGRKMALVIHDLTERLRTEAELSESRRLQSVGQLAGGVAHQFNNLLAAMMMNLNLLRINQPGPEPPEPIRELEGLSKRAAELVRQLLAFSRHSVIETQPVSLATVVEDAAGALREVLGESIRLVISAAGEVPRVEADPRMIQQALVNLSLNARDAMPAGGELRISVAETKVEPDQLERHPEARPGRFVCLSLTDAGCGMDEATLRQIFDPFFTTKDTGQRAGLGLPAVYGIVSQHHGWVEAESAVGWGTTVRLYLPAVPPPEENAPEDAGFAGLPGGRETILLTEDELCLRKATALFLRHLGYTVLEAGEADEALRFWQERADEIALLYADQMLPNDVSGIELAQRLRRDRPGLPVILTSGYEVSLPPWATEQAAGVKYLPKPALPEDLAVTIRACLDPLKPAAGA